MSDRTTRSFQEIVKSIAMEGIPGYFSAKRLIQTLDVDDRRTLAETGRTIEGLCKEVGI